MAVRRASGLAITLPPGVVGDTGTTGAAEAGLDT